MRNPKFVSSSSVTPNPTNYCAKGVLIGFERWQERERERKKWLPCFWLPENKISVG